MNSFGHYGMVECCVYHPPVHGREGVARALNTTQRKNYNFDWYIEWCTIKGRTELVTKRSGVDLTTSCLQPFSRHLHTTHKTATISLKKLVRKSLFIRKTVAVVVAVCMENSRIFSSFVWSVRGPLGEHCERPVGNGYHKGSLQTYPSLTH